MNRTDDESAAATREQDVSARKRRRPEAEWGARVAADASLDGYSRDPGTRVWQRAGTAGIAYSDGGAFEQRLLEQLRSAQDLSTLSDELVALIVDWPSEAHLSGSRANLLRPLQFHGGLRVLELGAGCGAITRYLGETGVAVDAVEGAAARAACAAERCRDLANVRVVCEEATAFGSRTGYDVVTLIGVLEYARLFVGGDDPVQALLAHARKQLAPGGAVLIAIENQLGLKYFNGCREDHLGAPYAGITDMYGPASPVTFGRDELARRLRAAGFGRIDWYFPFPDYKVPSTVIAERALDHPGFACGDLLFGEYARDYQGDALRNFDESAVWPVLARNGLLRDFSNSFLVVASAGDENLLDRDRVWLAQRYSTFRTRGFATNTSFLADDAGTIRVLRTPLAGGAPPPERPDEPVRIAQRLGREAYVRGRSFARRFADAVARGLDADGLAAELTPWIGYLVDRARGDAEAIPATTWSQMTVPGDLVDCTPFNLIVDESGDLRAIDLELVADRRIPLPWIALRGVAHTASRCFGHRHLAGRTCGEITFEILSRLGFGDVTDWAPYCALEDALIRSVLRPWPGRREQGMFEERLRLPVTVVRSAGEDAAVARATLDETRQALAAAAAREHEHAARAADNAAALAQAAATDAELAQAKASLASLEAELAITRERAADLDRQLAVAGDARRAQDEALAARTAVEQLLAERANVAEALADHARLEQTLGASLEESRTLRTKLDDALAERARLAAEVAAQTSRAGELEQARVETAALSRLAADAQERAGYEAGRAAMLERALAERDAHRLFGGWFGTRHAGVAPSPPSSPRSAREQLFHALRAVYKKLPIDATAKERAKGAFYRRFGKLFANQQNYQLWKALDLQPAGMRGMPVESAVGAVQSPTSAASDVLPPLSADALSRSVTIVIPAYGKPAMTRACIESVRRTSGGASWNFIVVDDASPEPLAPALAGMTGVTVLRNESNLGFIGACNRGAREADGSLLLFLNNDTEVKAGAIAAMIETFVREVDVGLVGAKLVFPDGRLQEAGCAIDRDGNAVMIGLWDDPARPRYNFERDVPYCSGACFMIERETFDALGGFDPAFAPAYCEDSDLCFRVRAAGKRVVYQPRAEVVHALSASMQDSPIDKMAVIDVNRRKFLERWGSTLADEDRIRAIALYLPQYHPIPENDRWWGEGFTEWTNVARARPSFEGHAQPNVPSELGYYDLRLPMVRNEQARLARECGLSAFCYYHYWFGGTRLLNTPLDAVLASGEPDFPFCVCWANENWTRRWDGLESEILIAQQHSPEDDLAFIESLLPAFRDPRYVRVHGKPLLLVYRPSLLPDAAATVRRWREFAERSDLRGLYVVNVQSFFHVDARGPDAFGFDAAVEFPPHSLAVECAEQPQGFSGAAFEGKAYDYPKTAESFLGREMPAYKVFRGVMPRWDNTPRRGTHANLFLGATPEAYRDWLERAVQYTRQMYFGDERLVFINAWNEWGEGNYLEPDARFGSAFLDATRRVLLR